MRTTRLVRLALAVIAVGIADDAYVHPEAGTAAGDHVASALIPVAALALLAAAYPRLRSGLRATLLIVVGVLAALAGTLDGVRHVVIAQASGDDVTAIVATVAGVWLFGLGVVTLWRSRRLDEPRSRRYARRALISVGGMIVVLFVVVPIGVAIVATHRARDAVPAADLGRPHERATLRTGDGLRLAAWYVPSRNRGAVIVFPGRTGPLPQARLLVRHGYGVLLLDRRGEGESEGDFNAFGWNGEEDLHAAIAYLRGRPDVGPRRIAGLGLSVGGELLLQTAAHDPALRAVVSEGAGARSLSEQLEMPGLPAWRRPLSPWLAQTAAVAVLADASPPPALGDLMRAVEQPVLLIHAADGHGDEQLNSVYAAHAGGDASRWVLPAGGHTGALGAQPREYERRVVGFLDRALAIRP